MTSNTQYLNKDENGYLINPTGEIIAYCRVSAQDQNLDRQLDAMLAYGVKPTHIFSEKASGKNLIREMYKRLIHILKRGDILVIKSIDRLGRNYNEILEQWRLITQDIGCGIHVIDMPSLNTSGDPDDLISRFITDMMLQVLSFVAQNERENTLKRQKEGIEAAKKRGIIKIGRPKFKIPFEFWEVYLLWKSGDVQSKEITKMCKEEYGMSVRTFYRRIRELDVRYGDLTPTQLRNLIVEDDFKDGISFDMERCEEAVDHYNPYSINPNYIEEIKQRKEERRRIQEAMDLEPRTQEEELKLLILEKRQQEFQKRFGIRPLPKKEEKKPVEPPKKRGRGRPPKSIYDSPFGKDADKIAQEAMTSSIKTVIID